MESMESNEPHFPAQMNEAAEVIKTPITAVSIADKLQRFAGRLEKNFSPITWDKAQNILENIELESNVVDMEDFVWQSEGFRVKPTCPFENTDRPIGFVKVTSGDHIPEVRGLDGPAFAMDYKYKFHGYHGTPVADVQILDQVGLDFVYITYSEALGSGMPSHFFMRFKDLEERLCGDYQRRLELYTLDWLVGAISRTAIDLDFHSTLTLDDKKYAHKDRGRAGGILLDMDRLSHKSHLPVWDQEGKLLDWSVSAQILGALLIAPPDMGGKPMMPNVYFRNLCRLAFAAATTPRSTFTVMGRFWSHRVSTQSDIKFRYMFPKSDSTWGDGINKLEEDFWKKVIRFSHEEVVSKLTRSREKNRQTSIFIPSKDCYVNTEDTNKEYFFIGSHPQRFLAFRPGYEKTPTIAKIKEWKLLIKDEYEDGSEGPEDTHTIILRRKLGTASNWPCKCSQNSLMEKKGANKVAEDLFERDNPTKRGMAVEWLHRSAYSFGGLSKKDNLLKTMGTPDTAQRRSNLVIGTYAANTRMIRYEEYLKRLVLQVDNRCIRLKTSLAYPVLGWNPESKKNSSWIAPALNYDWQICEVDGNVDKYCAGHTRFQLFSHNMSMRFEAMMDETLDMELYRLYNGKEIDSPGAEALLNALWRPNYTAVSAFV